MRESRLYRQTRWDECDDAHILRIRGKRHEKTGFLFNLRGI